MLKSMTAFSRKESVSDLGTLIWEMRSVNHRYLDVSLRLADEVRVIEPLVREKLSEKLSRGKLEASLRFTPAESAATQIIVNEPLAKEVLGAVAKIAVLDGGSNNQTAAIEVLRWPGVVGKVKADTEPLQEQALELLDTTIDDFIDTRAREGKKIAVMLEERCEAIEKIVAQVKTLRPQTNERQREKLIARIDALNVENDTSRLEQELVYVAQRLDVEEELDRLDAHVSELRDVLTRHEPVGRRLDFLVQEFNREANTLGSKSADAETTALAVDLKVLIEQMREQIQNLE